MSSLDPTELLSHTTWLRQLARSLVREGADDLLQDTWVAALRRPPHGNRGLRPWLRAVITNAARMRWRGDANRAAREQIAAAESEQDGLSSDELLQRHELQQTLARLVAELEEPYRSTILLRFAEGLTPSEIARRLSIPAGTVRWRLKEALARLRSELDATHKGERRAWMLLFGPLATPRAAPAVPVVPTIIAIATACILAIVVVARVWPESEPAPSSSPSSSLREHPALGRSSITTTSRDEHAQAEAVAWLAQEGVAPRHLTGRVLQNAAPVSGATVRLLSDPLAPRELKTDASGRFDFGQLAPRDYVVGASVPGKLGAIRRVDLRDPSAQHDIELVLQDCSASLYGKVTDASGTPIEGARVMREAVIGTETNRNGDYELCVLPTAALVAELRVVVRADGFGTITRPLAPTGRTRQDFILAPEATVAGRVIGPNQEPVANARVAIDLTGSDASAPPEYGFSLAAISDSEGRFRISGLAAGEYGIAAKSADMVTARAIVNVEATETQSVELRASATGTVRGRVLSQAGVPVGGVTVSAGSEVAVSQMDGAFVLARVPVGDVALDTTPYKRTSDPIHVVAGGHNNVDVIVEPMSSFRGIVRRRGVPVPFARVDIAGPSRAGVTADAVGYYEARGLEPGKYGFYCDDRRRGAMFAEDGVELGRAEMRDHDIELAWGGAIAGRVLNAQGDPVPDVEVSFRGGMTSECSTDATGAFVCGGLRGGTYVASVRPIRAVAHPFRLIQTPPTFELRDGDARIDNARLTVDATLSVIAGTVTDRSGGPVSDVSVRAFAVDLTQRTNFRGDLSAVSDGDGHFRINKVSAGDYYVEVERRGLATRKTVAAGAMNVSLVLDRPPCDGARGHDVPLSLTRPPAPIVWNQQIELLGWSLPAQASTRDSIELTLVYRAAKSLDRDWRIFAHFDSQTTRVNADHEPAIGWCPTSQWKGGETIVDHIPVRFDAPGRYALTVGFFTGKAPTWENLAISAAPAAMENTTQTGVHLGDVIIK